MTDEELDQIQSEYALASGCDYYGNGSSVPALIAEVRRLKSAIRMMEDEILGTCGAALDYPLVNGYFVTGDHVPETIVASLAQQYLDALNRIETLENIVQERGDCD